MKSMIRMAFEVTLNLSCEATDRPLFKHEILLHAQACRTLQASLRVEEDFLREDQVDESNST